MSALPPGKPLEHAISVINNAMRYARVNYWLCFGGLWGLIMNDGTIPDGDLDICVNYGEDYNRIARSFQSNPGGYTMSHAMLSDTDNMALHCGFNSSMKLPHICLSFWYLHDGIRYYCHDQNFEIQGEGVPKSGYYFKGVPSTAVSSFRLSEWPGITQTVKVSVPRFPGAVLDHLYPDWAYRKQKYLIKNNRVNKEKTVSIHKGGAISPYQIHVNSMSDFNNAQLIKPQLENSQRKYEAELKSRK